MSEYKIPKPLTVEQIAEQKKQLEKFLSDPEKVAQLNEELNRAGVELNRALGLTGNPQYDDFVRRAKDARWWNSIKDITFSNYDC